jgi:hypothetical protein
MSSDLIPVLDGLQSALSRRLPTCVFDAMTAAERAEEVLQQTSFCATFIFSQDSLSQRPRTSTSSMRTNVSQYRYRARQIVNGPQMALIPTILLTGSTPNHFLKEEIFLQNCITTAMKTHIL